MGKNILIIKHGSLGDLILATGAIKTISNHFKGYNIYFLTTSKYKKIVKQIPYIKNILIDDRKSFFNIHSNFPLFKKIDSFKFKYIFDLQNSKRTSVYNLIFRITSKSIISSSRSFSQYRYIIPKQGSEHATTGLQKQLNMLGIKKFYKPNVDWLKKEKLKFKLKKPFVILIPGTSINGHYKRWQPSKYAELAKFLDQKKMKIYVVGTKDDKESAKEIFNHCPNAINLLEKSSPNVLYYLAKKSKFIISNDTGPAQLVSLANKPLIWIVNNNDISKANKPIGKKIIKISANNVDNISVKTVKNTIIKRKLL